ncbi:MAG: SPOR domain-containing protein [Bacteroidetes bacterium]|nr:SPOR domain-containing protein [Bacteroidota bacterium]
MRHLLLLLCCLPWQALAQDKPAPNYGTTLDIKPYRQQVTFQDPYLRLETQEHKDAPAPLQQPVNIRFHMDTTIAIGMMQYANPYRSWRNTNGYRVQIYNGNREGANNAQFDFLELRVQEPVYMQYEAPNFKVRAGNFETESEALSFARYLQKHFAGAYVVPCEIELEDE